MFCKAKLIKRRCLSLPRLDVGVPLTNSRLTKAATGTSGSMLNVSMEKLKSLIIPLPPIKIQQQFAQIVEQIEEQKAVVKQSLAESEVLFEGLLAEYFA